MKIKIIMRHYLTPVDGYCQKNQEIKCWPKCGEKGTSVHCWWECKLIQVIMENTLEILQKTKNRTVYSRNPTVRHLSRNQYV
jgi:hypothetical protein